MRLQQTTDDQQGLNHYNTSADLAVKALNHYNYYNKNNKITKYELSSFGSGTDAVASEIPDSVPDASVVTDTLTVDSSCVLAPPILEFDDTNVLRAKITFFQNDTGTSKSTKLCIRLNLSDGTNPEFISNVNKRLRNFRSNIQGITDDNFIKTIEAVAADIKKQYDIVPYVGKFREKIRGKNNTSLEPNSAVLVWYDKLAKVWRTSIAFHQWTCEEHALDYELTEKQRAANVKADGLWINPLQQKPREMTYAEKRMAEYQAQLNKLGK